MITYQQYLEALTVCQEYKKQIELEVNKVGDAPRLLNDEDWIGEIPHLNARAYNALMAYKVRTVGDILKLTMNDLYKLHKCGEKSRKHIIDVCKLLGNEIK